MNAIDTLESIVNSKLSSEDLKFCLVDERKHPFRFDDQPARPNRVDDFVDIDVLFQCTNLEAYAGVGISVQASKIFAIDVDHCFEEAFNSSTISDLARKLLERFKNTYCEFSFSGRGMRILFRSNLIENYSDVYYIKNSKLGLEFYQPSTSYRYVTVTGRSLTNNSIINIDDLSDFLNEYMKKPERKHEITEVEKETRTFEELRKLVKHKYLRDFQFQDLWFTKAPGSGKDESERDYHLVAYLYENITKDKALIKQLFEDSEFFKTKDSKHVHKWTNMDFRYFEYLYNTINRQNHKKEANS